MRTVKRMAALCMAVLAAVACPAQDYSERPVHGLRKANGGTYYVARTLPEAQDAPLKREETLELVRKVATHYGTYLRAKAAEMPSSGQGGVRTLYFERIFYQPLELE